MAEGTEEQRAAWGGEARGCLGQVALGAGQGCAMFVGWFAIAAALVGGGYAMHKTGIGFLEGIGSGMVGIGVVMVVWIFLDEGSSESELVFARPRRGGSVTRVLFAVIGMGLGYAVLLMSQSAQPISAYMGVPVAPVGVVLLELWLRGRGGRG